MTSAEQHHTHLTQKLWLLKKFHFSERIRRDPTDYVSVAILDAVALYLTTGHPDAHLATFYATSHSILFLAKTSEVNSEDHVAVTQLVDEMREAKTFRDLLPFLARRSGAYVNKLVEKLRYNLRIGFFDLHHATTKINDSRCIAALERCRDLLASSVPFSDNAEACRSFGDLVLASRIVADRFPSRHSGEGPDTLRHRFEKVARYAGAQRLISFWKRYGSNIHVVWVPNMHPEVAVSHIIDATTIGEQQVDDIFPQYEDTNEGDEVKNLMLTDMDIRYVGWRGSSSVAVTLRIHPEIRLILFLIADHIVDARESAPELVLGCSQSICLCCGLWITAFNAGTGMNWATRSGNGHPRYDWALPHAQGIVPMGPRYDVDILKYVTDRMREVLNRSLGKAQYDQYDGKMIAIERKATAASRARLMRELDFEIHSSTI